MSGQGRSREGGCLCGAVRYRCVGEPLWVAHCHCRSCRRASGSVVMTWAGYRGENYGIIEGSPLGHESSKGVTRRFCGDCGTPLSYQSERYPGEVHITVGSLDHPEDMPPRGHVFTEEQISWLHIADDLPRFAKTSADEA
ncbi:MAG: GFA family protein [Proteobacteria bacterium]|nr:GFA family protein [Pseudomonadota bacterium]